MDIIHQHEAQHTTMPATTLTLLPQQGTGDGSRLVAVTAMVTRSPQDAVASLGGVDAVGQIPLERWDMDVQFSSGSSGMPSRFGAFLSRVDAFDANLFGVGGAEATLMDPQQRLLLETVAEAQLASVGRAAGGSWGVFVGVSSSDYQRLTAQQAQGFTGYNATSTFLRYSSLVTHQSPVTSHHPSHITNHLSIIGGVCTGCRCKQCTFAMSICLIQKMSCSQWHVILLAIKASLQQSPSIQQDPANIALHLE